MAESSSLSGIRYPIDFVLFDHGVGVVGGLADVIPDAEEIDVRGIFKALPGLDHRAEGPHLHPIEKPGIVRSARRCCPLLHAGCPVPELWLDAARIHIRWLDDMGIRRDKFVSCHDTCPLLGVVAPRGCRTGDGGGAVEVVALTLLRAWQRMHKTHPL